MSSSVPAVGYAPWPPWPPAPPPPPPEPNWAGFLIAIVFAVVLLGVCVLGVVVCVVVPPRNSHLLDRFRPSVRLTFLGAAAFIASASCNAAGFAFEWQPRRGNGQGTGGGWYFADFSPIWLDRVWQGHEASAIPYLFGEAAGTIAWACLWPSVANLALLVGGGGRPGTRLLTTCFGAVIAVSVLDLTLQAAMASLMERLHHGWWIRGPLPCPRTAPHPPPWTIRSLGARLRTPERGLSRVQGLPQLRQLGSGRSSEEESLTLRAPGTTGGSTPPTPPPARRTASRRRSNSSTCGTSRAPASKRP
jgi:hypothetical protein